MPTLLYCMALFPAAHRLHHVRGRHGSVVCAAAGRLAVVAAVEHQDLRNRGCDMLTEPWDIGRTGLFINHLRGLFAAWYDMACGVPQCRATRRRCSRTCLKRGTIGIACTQSVQFRRGTGNNRAPYKHGKSRATRRRHLIGSTDTGPDQLNTLLPRVRHTLGTLRPAIASPMPSRHSVGQMEV